MTSAYDLMLFAVLPYAAALLCVAATIERYHDLVGHRAALVRVRRFSSCSRSASRNRGGAQCTDLSAVCSFPAKWMCPPPGWFPYPCPMAVS